MNKRPSELFGKTPKIKTGCGNLYVTINENDGKPSEVLLTLGKAGGCASAITQAVGRLAGLALRKGATDEEVAKQLQGISCHLPTLACKSCIDGVAFILSENKELHPLIIESLPLSPEADNAPDFMDATIDTPEADRGKW